jgi:crotonobetainyl-CoA:carnitine CoA-transferase CaiB-like acyl-CoA transferase
MQKLPLDGIRVVDLSWAIAGPYASQWMGVMGAEIIRIESSLRPGLLRRIDIGADGKPGLNREPAFNAYNYGKKSCTLNLARPVAIALIKELIKISDVVMDNFAFGVMERLGLDYPSLRELKPDIIVLSISILGRTGPKKEYFGWGPTGLAHTGLLYMTGYPESEPKRIGGAWPDPMASMYSAFAVLAALHHRERTGEGQFIDVSMGETVITQIPEAVMDYTLNGRVRGRVANRDDFMAPHGVYRCHGEDKWVAIAVSSDEEWQALCHAMGDPPWCCEERFSNALSRWHHQEELDRLIEGWTRNHSHYEVMEMLQRAGVAAGPSLSASELVDDPHLKERGLFVEIDHPEVGRRRMVGLPVRLSSNLPLNYEHAPLLGEHNQYVFGELLGLAPDEVAHLMEEGVIC